MKDTKVDPGEKLIGDYPRSIRHKLKLSKLNLHVFDRVLGRVSVLGKLNRPCGPPSDIVRDTNVWIRCNKRLSVVSERFVEIHQERNAERCQLVKVGAVGLN